MKIAAISALIVVFSMLLLDREIRHRELAAKALENRLEKKWQAARDLRISWEKDNLNQPLPFLDREYMALWQDEINAESTLLHKSPGGRVTTSWHEYQKKREQAGLEV